MDADLDTLVTALYVTTDDFLIEIRSTGRGVRRSGSPLVSTTPNWSPWWRCKHCSGSPRRPGGCAMRTAVCAGCSLICQPNRVTTNGYAPRPGCCARSSRIWLRAPLGALDDVWVVDSTPVECGRLRETTKRSDLAGWAEYGYCASHSAFSLGIASASGVRPVGAAGGVCADWRQGRRARHSARDARRRPEPARHPSADVDGRQELLRPPIRNRARRRRYRPAAPCPQGRETPCGTTLLQATAAGCGRIGQQHPQDPARPRTPRRTHHRRSRRTCPTTPSSPSPPPSGTTTEPTSRSCDH